MQCAELHSWSIATRPTHSAAAELLSLIVQAVTGFLDAYLLLTCCASFVICCGLFVSEDSNLLAEVLT